jgi:hypothetical protein
VVADTDETYLWVLHTNKHDLIQYLRKTFFDEVLGHDTHTTGNVESDDDREGFRVVHAVTGLADLTLNIHILGHLAVVEDFLTAHIGTAKITASRGST